MYSTRDKTRRVVKFKYQGSTVTEDSNLDEEVTREVESGWKNTRMMFGVLCARRINVKLKGLVYKTV